MKTVKLKYGCNVAGKFIPKGTVVETMDALDERVQAVWPGIQFRMASNAVAVQFPHLSFPTLIHKDEIEEWELALHEHRPVIVSILKKAGTTEIIFR